MMRAVVVAALVAVTLGRAEAFESTQWIMGTSLRVVSPETLDAGLVADAMNDARALEDLLSTWRDDTPLARFNDLPAGTHAVEPRLVAYLLRVKADHARTGGAFDPSIATLRVDPDAALGMDLLSMDAGTVVRPHDAFAVDSGGDGKGLAVDAMIDHLRAAGVHAALVDFGGSSWFGLGRAGPDLPWRIALTHGDAVVGRITLEDRALSISSTVQTDLGPDGARSSRHHLIDPRTRRPVTADRTVAVLAATAVEAEVLSTAIAVDGLDVARRWLGAIDGVEIVVVESGVVTTAGPAFTAVGTLRD